MPNPNPQKRRISRWARVFQHLGARASEAKKLRRVRRQDREGYATPATAKGLLDYYTHSGIAKYNQTFNRDLVRDVENALRTTQRINMLDIGAAEGVFLRQMKAIFGARVRTVATSLTRPPERIGIDEYYVGKTSSPKTRFAKSDEKYDFIISHSGETQSMQPKELIRILNRLTRKGVAFVDLGAMLEPIMDDYLFELQNAGFRTEITNEWQHGGSKIEKVVLLKVSRVGDIRRAIIASSKR